MRGTWPSTSRHSCHERETEGLVQMFDPAVADCGSQGTASSPSSVPERNVSRGLKRRSPPPRRCERAPAWTGGDERVRTADLCLAKAALSQLSYIPVSSEHVVAEREGFEPSVGYKPTHDFQSCTLNHSVTSPRVTGGGGGIRTHGTPRGTTVFETATIDQLRHPTVCFNPGPAPRPSPAARQRTSRAATRSLH